MTKPEVVRNALRNAIIVGTAVQLVMVACGHWVAFVRLNVFAVGGVVISALVGAMYARDAQVTRGKAATGGAIAGGVCALIGIAVSLALGDVPPIILVVGTLSSAIGGAVGGGLSGRRA
ncbi:MAG: hypothetical protein ACREN6_10075 [Gemmatimonadaceae bacterium]